MIGQVTRDRSGEKRRILCSKSTDTANLSVNIDVEKKKICIFKCIIQMIKIVETNKLTKNNFLWFCQIIFPQYIFP